MQFKDFKFMLQNEDLTPLYKKLGYGKVSKLKKAIDVIISSKSLDDFIDKGYYDGLYSSEELILALCKALNADLKDELALVEKLSIERNKFKCSYIYVDTDTKIFTQPIFIVAMVSGIRYISLYRNKELYFKSLDEKLNIISKMVIYHYNMQKGELPIFGNIIGYKVCLEGKNYAFSVTGELMQKEITESVATLTYKNKNLTSVLKLDLENN